MFVAYNRAIFDVVKDNKQSNHWNKAEQMYLYSYSEKKNYL